MQLLPSLLDFSPEDFGLPPFHNWGTEKLGLRNCIFHCFRNTIVLILVSNIFDPSVTSIYHSLTVEACPLTNQTRPDQCDFQEAYSSCYIEWGIDGPAHEAHAYITTKVSKRCWYLSKLLGHVGIHFLWKTIISNQKSPQTKHVKKLDLLSIFCGLLFCF